MNTESRFIQIGEAIDYTPSSARLAGQVVQVDDGRAGICADDIAASALGAAQVDGIIEIRQKAEIIVAGTVVGWDEDGDPYGGTAGSGAITQYLANVDFIVGKVQATTTATDETAKVDLNEIGQSSPVVYTQLITAAQMKLLATTQIQLVPAPGADKVVQVLGVQGILDYGSEVLAEPSAPDDLEIVYDTAGGTSIADIVGDFVILAADSLAQPQIKDNAGVAATTMVNKAVVLDNNGANYTGNASNDTVFTFKLTCVINKCALA